MRFAAFASLFLATALLADPPHTDWPKYCGNLSMTGTADGAGSVSSQTAPFLSLLWKTQLVGPIASQPTVVGDRIYVGDWAGNEWALDVTTGEILAQNNLGMTTAPQCFPSQIGITSTATVWNGNLYLAGGDDAFYALDAQTLDVIWRHSLGDNSASGGYYGWCSPVVDGSKVLQGVSSNCDDPFVPGRLVGLDLFDGTTKSEAALVTPDPSHDPTGSGVWTSPAVDQAARDIFITTASANQLDDGYAYSIVRVDRDTLVIQEAWKITDVNQADDPDWGTSPTLFNDSNNRQLVGAGQKNGRYYAFPRHGLASGPIWDTQLALGGACPQCADGILSTAAFDGTRLYVGSGRPPNQDDSIIGAIYALNPDDGSILWQYLLTAPVIAPISYANGVVFTAAGQSGIALDAATGMLLWQGNTADICYGGVAITDRGIFFGDLAGNLYAYGITSNVSTRVRAVRR